MNVKRFTARTAREALALVREALGDDAVVLSTRPSPEGVEVLALAPEGMARITQAAAQTPVQRAPQPHTQPVSVPAAPAPAHRPSLAERIAARGERLEPRAEPRIEPSLDAGAPSRFDPTRTQALPEPGADHGVARDVETLGMSTLTFQDYVRERMLKRRQAELEQQAPASLPDAMMPAASTTSAPPSRRCAWWVPTAAAPPRPRRRPA